MFESQPRALRAFIFFVTLTVRTHMSMSRGCVRAQSAPVSGKPHQSATRRVVPLVEKDAGESSSFFFLSPCVSRIGPCPFYLSPWI